jgi:hypothetical protein
MKILRLFHLKNLNFYFNVFITRLNAYLIILICPMETKIPNVKNIDSNV